MFVDGLQRHRRSGADDGVGAVVQRVSVQALRHRTGHGPTAAARRLPVRAPLRRLRAAHRFLATASHSNLCYTQ